MITFVRTDIHHPDFQDLVKQLDVQLTHWYGSQMEVFNPLNVLKEETYCLVAKDENNSVGIGAFRIMEDESAVEIKRMFVHPNHRGKGISKLILQELENWAKEKNFKYAKLETGHKNIAAKQLYQKAGYVLIEPFGPYQAMDRNISFCYGKKLI